MICSRCGDKEASTLFTQLADNRVSELRVCAECARALEDESNASASPVTALLSALGLQQSRTARRRLKCAQCGLAYSEFRKSGYLGCAACYRSFAEPLAEILMEIHGADRHGGKTPPLPAAEEITRLRAALEQAIKDELFEKAAQLRDRLKTLEKGCS